MSQELLINSHDQNLVLTVLHVAYSFDSGWGLYEQLLQRYVKWFRGGLVFKAHRLLYHSTLGARVTKKKKKFETDDFI